MKTRPSRLRAGIIGISGYGRIHLQLAREWADRGELSLAAAVVINPGEEEENVRQLKAAGCLVYRSYEDMLGAENGNLDLCLIPTGIAWHSRMTLAALRAGANVLVEKPLSSSTADVEEMARVAAGAGRFVAVGFQDIYEPVAQELKRLLVAGAIGRLRSVRFLGLWPRPGSYYTRNGWAGRLRSGDVPVLDSPLNNAFAHFVNLGLFFSGSSFAESAEATQVEAVLWRTNAIESFDSGVVRARGENGVRLWFGASHACAATREPEIIIEGEGGRAVWRHERECVLEVNGRRTLERTLPPTAETRRSMLRAVVENVRVPGTFVCGPEIAIRHTALIEAAHRSTGILVAPGTAVLRQLPALAEPVLCTPGIESTLLHAFDTESLPAAS